MSGPNEGTDNTTVGCQPDPASEAALTIEALFGTLGAAFPAEDILADRLKSRHAAQLRDRH